MELLYKQKVQADAASDSSAWCDTKIIHNYGVLLLGM
jgi:hypothetical protein